MAIKTSSIETTQKWLFRVGIAFLGACVAHAATGGWALADGHAGKGVLYAIVMIAITIGAATLLVVVDKAARAGRAMVALGLFGGWVVLQAGEAVGNLMAMGHTRNQSITLANVADHQATDRRKSIGDAERAIALVETSIGERTKVAGWLSTKPAEAWRAEIANLEGDKIYARSKQCANVTLPDSRVHCDKVKEARANLAVAEAHEADARRLEQSRAALARMREEARTDKPGVSASRTQSDNLVRVAGLIQGTWVPAADDDGRARANFAVELFMVIVMMLGPAALIYAGSIDWTPRPKRPSLLSRGMATIARLKAWKDGKPYEASPLPAAPIATGPRPYIKARRIADLLPQSA